VLGGVVRSFTSQTEDGHIVAQTAQWREGRLEETKKLKVCEGRGMEEIKNERE
jgi:hypothetical protein